jgi:hypothetical protein
MTDVNVQEQGTYPAKYMIDDYFGKIGTDLRYTHTEYRQFNPQTGLDKNSAKMNFVLPPIDPPYCYQLSDALIEVTMNITKGDGQSMPDPSKKVGPVNNVLGSLFETLDLKINDNSVSESSDNFYHYRCYLKRLLTFNEDVKLSQYVVSGFITDTCSLSGHIEPALNNQGWLTRGNMFREGYSAGGAFRPEGATFVGPLMHDLSYINKALPPSEYK